MRLWERRKNRRLPKTTPQGCFQLFLLNSPQTRPRRQSQPGQPARLSTRHETRAKGAVPAPACSTFYLPRGKVRILNSRCQTVFGRPSSKANALTPSARNTQALPPSWKREIAGNAKTTARSAQRYLEHTCTRVAGSYFTAPSP